MARLRIDKTLIILNEDELRARAWSLVEPHFLKARQDAAAKRPLRDRARSRR